MGVLPPVFMGNGIVNKPHLTGGSAGDAEIPIKGGRVVSHVGGG